MDLGSRIRIAPHPAQHSRYTNNKKKIWMDNKAINKYEHCHSSIRWLIRRGARTTSIRNRKNPFRCDINDDTFLGLDLTSRQSLDPRICNSVADTGEVKLQAGGTGIRGSSLNDQLSVILSGCRRLTDVGVSAIARGCPYLTTIVLNSCSSITDMGISAIAQGCPHLSTISLVVCRTITDTGIFDIAEGCPRLTTISLYNCYRITDAGVSAIAEGCFHLTTITLDNCNHITDVGISAIAEGCPHLATISVKNCQSITDEFISATNRRCPHLTLL